MFEGLGLSPKYTSLYRNWNYIASYQKIKKERFLKIFKDLREAARLEDEHEGSHSND